MRRLATVVVALALLAVQAVGGPAPRAWANTGVSVTSTTTVSVTPAGEPADAESVQAVMTPDARYVAFTSSATNLRPDLALPTDPGNANATYAQVYLYGRQQHTVDVVSRASDGTPANRGGVLLGMSADARFVLFVSDSTNLAPGRPVVVSTCFCGFRDIFLRDRQTGTTTLITLPSLYSATAYLRASISDDGTVIAYSGLVSLPSQGAYPTQTSYVHNRTTGRTMQLSPPASSYVSFPAVSRDGHYVIYNSSTGLYRYDTGADRSDRLLPEPMSMAGVLSPDNTKLAYYASGTELDVLNLMTGERTVVADGPQVQFDLSSLSFDASGRYLTYFTRTPGVFHGGAAWIADLSAGETTQLVALTQQGEGLQLSADASVLLYTSYRGSGTSQIHLADLSLPVRDTTPPVVTGAPDREPGAGGWYTGDVTVTWTATDNGGSATQPALTIASTEGAAVAYTSEPSCDPSGNCAVGSVPISIDRTAPTTGAATWSANPQAVGSSATLTVAAGDALSGVAGGEYFVGTDPGPGYGTPVAYGDGSLSAVIGAGLDVGVHTVGVRARDAAGNWSAAATTMLVLHDTTSPLAATGKNKKDLVPSLANGDVVPGLTSAGQADAADYGFTVEHKGGVLDVRNDFVFTYRTGTRCGTPSEQGCHAFSLNAESFTWLVVDGPGNSRARFGGTAVVTVDGATTVHPFTVEAIDGDRLTQGANDALVLTVYPTGSDPLMAAPLYRASGLMAKGSSVRIR
ncbi:hypothetical protein OHA72_22590 [Dactylosporangium sp. NBC_01737]|uniref:hypothetical protein n=1 Tax=Dactylosporangium sp. NBC_01737 TaxID=2975959 RepID=UPI002E0DB00A|nr:hypothetical protein OHA72_22590 [Dactylosporangium sp. NBC_01737]